MVAKSPNLDTRFPPGNIHGFGRVQWFHFTRRDVDRLIQDGLLNEDATTELLDGMIVLKDRAATGEVITAVGTDHTVCVELLSNLRSEINSTVRHVRSQQPLVCREDHVPEPDFMVLRGNIKSYADLPTAADAFCVLEVADSSYERDAGQKLVAYARAGVRQYIVLDLRHRSAEIYTQPDPAGTYPPPQIISADGKISLRVGEGELFTVPLADVLP